VERGADALATAGGERTVDLAEVNGRVFVNNVSLGLQAEAVQRGTVPDVLGSQAGDLDLDWMGPDGARSDRAPPRG
jgi:hypothetical protein